MTKLSKRIREARVKVRLSQSELAKAIGVSDKAISSYEQSRTVPPFAKLRKIAEYTHHPLTYFTEQEGVEADITSRLVSIERELEEIRKLLKKSK